MWLKFVYLFKACRLKEMEDTVGRLYGPLFPSGEIRSRISSDSIIPGDMDLWPESSDFRDKAGEVGALPTLFFRLFTTFPLPEPKGWMGDGDFPGVWVGESSSLVGDKSWVKLATGMFAKCSVGILICIRKEIIRLNKGFCITFYQKLFDTNWWIVKLSFIPLNSIWHTPSFCKVCRNFPTDQTD